jgi:hypothetical protein
MNRKVTVNKWPNTFQDVVIGLVPKRKVVYSVQLNKLADQMRDELQQQNVAVSLVWGIPTNRHFIYTTSSSRRP